MTEECYGQSDNSEGNISSANGLGMQFSTGSNPVGKDITGCKFYCKTSNNGTNNELYAKIWSSTDVEKASSTNSVNNNTLNPQSATEFTEMDFTFDGTYTLADGDIIGVKNSNPTGTNLRPAQQVSMSSGQNPAFIEYKGPPDSEWGDPVSTNQFKSCVSYSGDPPPVSSSTRLPPPPIEYSL